MIHYCERLDMGFWAEPVNALTNLFFLIAATLAYRMIRQMPCRLKTPALLLAAILFIIGIGSFLWHTLATPWSGAADVLPILMFNLLYVFFFFRDVLGFGAKAGGLAVAGYLGGSVLLYQFLDPRWWHGSVGYLSTVLMLIVMGALLRHPVARLYWMTVAIFTLSLTFRSLDAAACDLIPFGTHFLWHTLNAVTLFLLIRVLCVRLALK